MDPSWLQASQEVERFMKTLKKTFQTAVIERKSMQHLNHRIITLLLHTLLPGSLQQLHYLIDHLIDYYESSCLHYSKQANAQIMELFCEWNNCLELKVKQHTDKQRSLTTSRRMRYMG